MATWTNIPDSVLEPGKPARSVDALALRDNAIAIAEGATNAPRIAGQQGPAVYTGGIANGAVTNVKIANMDAGKLNSGTVPGARIPTGHGGVGTYAIVYRTVLTSVGWGGTISGSQLTTANIRTVSAGTPVTLAGTWRVMSQTIGGNTDGQSQGLAVRIS